MELLTFEQCVEYTMRELGYSRKEAEKELKKAIAKGEIREVMPPEKEGLQ